MLYVCSIRRALCSTRPSPATYLPDTQLSYFLFFLPQNTQPQGGLEITGGSAQAYRIHHRHGLVSCQAHWRSSTRSTSLKRDSPSPPRAILQCCVEQRQTCAKLLEHPPTAACEKRKGPRTGRRGVRVHPRLGRDGRTLIARSGGSTRR